jgi:hypothetical protein
VNPFAGQSSMGIEGVLPFMDKQPIVVQEPSGGGKGGILGDILGIGIGAGLNAIIPGMGSVLGGASVSNPYIASSSSFMPGAKSWIAM